MSLSMPLLGSPPGQRGARSAHVGRRPTPAQYWQTKANICSQLGLELEK